MNIKVAVFTVSEKSSNTFLFCPGFGMLSCVHSFSYKEEMADSFFVVFCLYACLVRLSVSS